MTRVAFWRDLRMIRVMGQFLFVGAVILILGWLLNNMRIGLGDAGISISYGFLSNASGFQINLGLNELHSRTDTYANAFWIGFLNTMRVIIMGLVLSTVLGLVVGIARLSSNWLLRNLALVFIEIIQNTPLLVQLIFVYAGILPSLPGIRNAAELPGPSYLSVKGLAIPALNPTDSSTIWYLLALGGIVGGYMIWRARRKMRLDTGKVTYAAEIGLVIMFGVGAFTWLVMSLIGSSPFMVSLPRIQGFNYASGEGAIIPPELVAIIIGLTLYTGAFIAEVVRSGIQSVPHGQWEAARAQGFSYFQTLRLIVLPQALRVMIPPLTNQYLNLAKNSSLGTACGYAELFFVARTMSESVPVVPVILFVMVTYLLISLAIAGIMNVLNSRFQLKTR
ncbi:MAG: ABC transporter permease subunit [Anaerolineae bacterium]|nr:ABC transporter permease subunit [Anaerolineae bacterium]